jgi:hypothetical protein
VIAFVGQSWANAGAAAKQVEAKRMTAESRRILAREILAKDTLEKDMGRFLASSPDRRPSDGAHDSSAVLGEG